MKYSVTIQLDFNVPAETDPNAIEDAAIDVCADAETTIRDAFRPFPFTQPDAWIVGMRKGDA